jgi:hypothetical protein
VQKEYQAKVAATTAVMLAVMAKTKLVVISVGWRCLHTRGRIHCRTLASAGIPPQCPSAREGNVGLDQDLGTSSEGSRRSRVRLAKSGTGQYNFEGRDSNFLKVSVTLEQRR